MANRTDACFIRVIGSELVQKYVGEGARMVRELFQMARSKKACLIFFDEVRLEPAGLQESAQGLHTRGGPSKVWHMRSVTAAFGCKCAPMRFLSLHCVRCELAVTVVMLSGVCHCRMATLKVGSRTCIWMEVRHSYHGAVCLMLIGWTLADRCNWRGAF